MQLRWGFVKLLIKESYIATSKSMTLSGKVTFMAPENITLFRYCLVTAKYVLSEAEMAQWKAETTHPFFDRCYGKVKCYFLFPGINQHISKLWDLVKGRIEGRGDMTTEEIYSKGWLFERYIYKESGGERNLKASLFWLPVLLKCP